MKIFRYILPLYTLLLFGSCIKSGQRASSNDLMLISGIKNHCLYLDGREGATTTFSFTAKHDWEIIDYKGFECLPSSGPKCIAGETVTVTATTLQANNSADTILLSGLNFKLLSTRFVGVSAYQLPIICFPKGNQARVDASSGSKATVVIASNAEDIELVVTGEIVATLSGKSSKNEHIVTITSTTDNNLTTDRIIGSVGFKVDGAMQAGKIEVVQTSAIVMDRSTVLLPGTAGGENMLTISSEFDVDVYSSSNLFTITENGNKSYTIKAKEANTTAEEISLGEIEVKLKDDSGCKSTIEVRQRIAKAPQTIIAYFIGTALQYYFNNNVDKILEALNQNIQKEARIVAICTTSATDATMYELRYDRNLGKAVKEKIKELQLYTPYDSALFESNIRNALLFAPAERYALVVGSHGLGWISKYSNIVPSRALMQLGISPNDLWQRDKDAEITRHLGDKTPTRYDIMEIASAIKANNISFDYILFDACFMGNIESVYELRDVTKYIIGSPCEVMGAGFPYAKIIPHMLTNSGTSYDLDKLCHDYVEYYRTEAATPSACVAITHTAELEALASAMKKINAAGIKDDFSLSNVQYYEGLSAHSFYDLEDMVEQSCADETAASEFKRQLEKTVTSRYHTDRFYTAYGGGTHYHDIKYYGGISTSAMVDHYYADWKITAWYRATH